MKFYEKSNAFMIAFEKRVKFLQTNAVKGATLNQIDQVMFAASKKSWANI